MSNVLSEEKKQQVIALGRLGWSLRRIQRETGIRRETIAAYLEEAGVERRPPRGRQIRPKPASPPAEVFTDSTPANPASPAITDSDSAKPASRGSQVITESSADSAAAQPSRQPGRSPSASACEAYRDAIEAALSLGRNAKVIWQDLVDAHGFAGSYQSVRRFVSHLRGSQLPAARVVIETAPGEELQVDYGAGPMIREFTTGKYKRSRLFVLTLGYSRKSVRLLVFRSSAQTWAELHEKAFRRLGGVTQTVVLDNLREGVLSPDIYDPTLNPLYRDVLRHYGTIPLPCRAGDPDRKALNSYCTS